MPKQKLNTEAESAEPIKDAEVQEVADANSNELVVYDYADAAIYCHSCGKVTGIDHEGFTNVSGGVTIPLTANNSSHLTLSCMHCSAILSLFMMPAKNPPKSEVKAEEPNNKDNDTSEDSEAERHVQGVREPSELGIVE